MRLAILAALALCPCLMDGLCSADAPSPPPQGALYLGKGRMLEAAAPRQLSLNAHVSQFVYGPSGLEIAYAGSQVSGDSVTQFIRLAGVRFGTTATLLSQTFHISADGQPDPPDFTLIRPAGWSADERYFLIAKTRFMPSPPPSAPGDLSEKDEYVVVDVGQSPMHYSYVALPDQSDSQSSAPQSYDYWWSPDRMHILFALQCLYRDSDKHYMAASYCGVYDPAQSRLKPVFLAEKMFTHGWIDDDHLLMVTRVDGAAHYFSEDVNDGKQTEVAKPTKMPAAMDDLDLRPTNPAFSPKSGLLLEDETKTATDTQQAASTPYHALWVRRSSGPKTLSAMPVGLTPGADDTQARWSPTGQQVAFVAHGDLFVTDLTTRDATAKEKYLVGEPLTCPEERELASESLKQIGLGILQYTQDYDENFPPAQGVNEALKPYLPSDVLMSIGGHPFVYHAPANLSLASLDSPADTVLGTISLPCATVTLFADGHVKSLP